MIIYTFYIFHANGTCLFYKDLRKQPSQSDSVPSPNKSSNSAADIANGLNSKPGADPDADQIKLVFGLLHSLRTICAGFSPHELSVQAARESLGHGGSIPQSGSSASTQRSQISGYSQGQTPSAPPGQAAPIANPKPDSPSAYPFYTFATDKYRLHYLETPSSLKFVCTTEPTCAPQRELLYSLYVNVYGECIVRNPLLTPGQPLRSELFASRLDQALYRAIEGAPNSGPARQAPSNYV